MGPTDDPLALRGRQLGGRYLVERQLGAGGMGLVYQALAISDGPAPAPCALKLLRPELGLSAHADELVRRFRREARLGERAQHEGLVQCFDFGQLEDGTLYYAMELLGGMNAGELLGRLGPLPWADAAAIALQAAEALTALHADHMVHRDLKPENLQVLDDGRVKVLDLGVAHVSAVLQSDADDLTDVRTRTGQYLGTPAYMAPEQIEDSRRVDGRADVYALALVLYELCCGGQPFRGRRFEEILQLKFLPRPVPPLRRSCPAAPAALGALVAAGLGPLRERPTMAAFGEALGALLQEDRPTQRQRLAERVARAREAPIWSQPTAPPAAQRRRARWVAAALSALATGALGAVLAPLLLRAPRPGAEPAAALTEIGAAAPVSVRAPAVEGASAPARPDPGGAPRTTPPLRVQPAPRKTKARQEGRLRIAVRPFADVFIDGVHRLEGSPHTYTLPAGRHKVRAINTALGRDETCSVEVPPRGQAEVDIDWGAP